MLLSAAFDLLDQELSNSLQFGLSLPLSGLWTNFTEKNLAFAKDIFAYADRDNAAGKIAFTLRKVKHKARIGLRYFQPTRKEAELDPCS